MSFTGSEESVPKGFDRDVLRREVIAATSVLGISAENVSFGRHKVRRFSEVRQEILDSLIEVRKEYQPDLVLLPSSQDVHQDHAVVFQEGLRAFKLSTMLGYDLPWNIVGFPGRLFVTISEHDLDRKIRAITEYKSQATRPYMNDRFLRSQAVAKGAQSGNEYAELFEILRWHIR